jgi:acyl-CoA ligase (AMP-forming) (exosortase A-associated)
MMTFLVHHMLQRNAVRRPDKEALVHGSARLTYAEVAGRVGGLAEGLRRAGITRGDRVGIYLDPSVPQVLSIFGVSEADGVFVPINPLLFPEQVAHIVSDCRMKGLITSATKLKALPTSLGSLGSLEFLVVVDGAGAELPDLSIPAYDFAGYCKLPQLSRQDDACIEKDLAAILYTSGSTGRPKGVMLSHAQIMAGSSIVSTYLEITEADKILAILPFSFDAGMNQLMTAFQQGGTIILMTFVFAREIVQMLERERATGLAGVPTLWSLLAQPSSSLHKTPLPDLRYVTNTGGVMPQAVLATLRQALPKTRIFLMYGLTEAFRSTYLPPDELDRRPTSMGKAIPDTEILVVNEDGQPCKPGEVGELVHRGPTVSMGYWGQPDLTARVLRPHPFLPSELGSDEKVCYSGDLVTLDEDGFLYFIGRRDALIKCSGFRVSPTEVEETLFQSGKLREAGVIGVPDLVLGQSIKALVVLADGQSGTPEELIEFCATRLPHYMVPRVIEIVDSLPRTTSGKVDYPALRRREGLA